MDDGGFGNYGMGLDAFDPEGQQGMEQVASENLDPFVFGLEPSVTWDTPLADPHLGVCRWGGDQMELEISKEGVGLSNETSFASELQPSTLSAEDTTPSTNESQQLPRDEKSLNNDVPSRSASSHRETTNKWTCDFTDCGKCFTHRYKLNRHRKYHIKEFRCLDPACVNKGIVFTLHKDLERHEAKHTGRRHYCPHAGCSYASEGTEGGFTRKDNLRRHIRRKH